MSTPAMEPQTRPSVQSGQRFARIIAALLLVVGIQLWLLLGNGEYGTWTQRRLLMLIAAIALVPRLANLIAAQLDRVRNQSPQSRAITATCVAVTCAAYFLLSAAYRSPQPVLKFVDEHSYAIGMQQAARFRLWMPQHLQADFFEAQNLFIRPVYASAYFPGTAMVYAPSVWLGLRYWVWTCLIAGACGGLMYRVVAELLDGLWGLLAAMMLPGSALVRIMSTMLMSQLPMLLLSLLMLWIWLRWRHARRQMAWITLMGVVGGLALITRPLDAMLAVTPLAAAFAIDCRDDWRRMMRVAAVAGLCAIPFVALQIVFNVAATGSWHQTPYAVNVHQDHPELRLGFHTPDPTLEPQSTLPQKLLHYHDFVLPSLREHRLDNMIPGWLSQWLMSVVNFGLPHPLLLVLVPLGLMDLRHRRWVPIAIIPLWLGLYFLYPIPLVHYFITALVGMNCLIVNGIRCLRQAWPRFSTCSTVFFTLSIVMICITQLPEFRRLGDDWFDASELIRINNDLAHLPQTPAVVLFHFEPSVKTHVEPVYNVDVPWPDDAKVIRAHDLGPRNIQIYRYYAQRQPTRMFYLYNRVDGSIKPLGTAKDLAGPR